MIDIVYIFPLLLAILVYAVWKLYRSGMLDSVEVTVSEKPPLVNRPLTVYYKHHIGAYKGVGKLFTEVSELMPQGAVRFGIYYDKPDEVKEHLLQSAVGVIFGEDGKDGYPANYGEQLTRWGYERMQWPVVDKAVVATQKFEGFFSVVALVKFTYAKISAFVKKNNLNVRFSMEFYDSGKVHVVMPLDHQKEFLIHQLMTLEELETKLARRKWDSDVESESCSDTELEKGDDGSEAPEDVDEEAVELDKKKD